MRFLQVLAQIVSVASAASSFAGSNLYYAAGPSTSQQATLFFGLKDANVKVLRVWLDGEYSPPKGTSFTSYPSLEGTNGPGASDGWGDTVLNRLANFLDNAKKHGIRLTISIHSYNALSGNSDFYGTSNNANGELVTNIIPQVRGMELATSDYTDSNAISYFKSRVNRVMNHVNPHNGKRWAHSPEYIFSFEAQNEAMHEVVINGIFCVNASLLIRPRATHLPSKTGNAPWPMPLSRILVNTGGGSHVDTSLQDGYFGCSALHVLAIHAYGTGDFSTSKLIPYVQKAQQHGKKLIMQEWGACCYSSTNNRCDQASPPSSSQRDANLKQWANSTSKAEIPWQYWQILPDEDPYSGWDYEVGINGVNWRTLKSIAPGTRNYNAALISPHG